MARQNRSIPANESRPQWLTRVARGRTRHLREALDPRNRDRFIEIRMEVSSDGNRPPSALITVAGFAQPGMLVEIQGVAVIGGRCGKDAPCAPRRWIDYPSSDCLELSVVITDFSITTSRASVSASRRTRAASRRCGSTKNHDDQACRRGPERVVAPDVEAVAQCRRAQRVPGAHAGPPGLRRTKAIAVGRSL